MSAKALWTCDSCGGVDDENTAGWMSMYGYPNGATLMVKVHFCSGACIATYGTMLAMEPDATTPYIELDEAEDIRALEAVLALPSATPASRIVRPAPKPRAARKPSGRAS